jgi:hypothetical protein
MKNTQLAQNKGLTNLQLTDDQIITLSDLLSDQVCIQRVMLRETPLKSSYIKSLTHFRHLKSMLYNKARNIYYREAMTEQEAGDIELAYILRAQ